MDAVSTDSLLYVFEGFRLDARIRQLTDAGGATIPISGRAFDVLVYLIENSDRVVSRDELLDRVWKDRVVEENNLTQAISALRKAFHDGSGDRRIILTLPGRGYRFVAAVEQLDGSGTGSPLPADRDSATFPRQREFLLRPLVVRSSLAALLVFLAALLVFLAARHGPGLQATESPRPIVAVLPFLPVSEDPADDLLALGLAETLITRLGRSDAIRVVAFGSSERSTGLGLDPQSAGRRLNADYVVTGSTQRSGASLRVNARLLVLPSGMVVWAETLDTEVVEAFAVQDRIAAELASALGLPEGSLSGREAAPCMGDDAEAYRSLLTGLRQIQTPSPMSLQSALQAFNRTVELDPTCARAWAGLGFVWRALSITGDIHPLEAFPNAIESVDRALELDPALPEAHASLGFIQFWHHWDWAAAEASFRRAIDLNPSLAEARFAYAHLLSNLGRFEEALDQARQARELDPFWPLLRALESSFLRAAGHHAEARQRIEQTVELAPDFWIARVIRAEIAMDLEDHESAVSDLERADQLSGGATQTLALLGVAYARAGDLQKTAELLERLEIRARESYVPATAMASVRNALGETDAALDLLDRAWEERDLLLTFLKVDRRWDNLRDEPRFIELFARMGFEP